MKSLLGVRISNWTYIFLITFGVQLFRRQYSDAIIFGIATTVLLIQPIQKLHNFSLPRLKLDKRTLWFLVSFLGLTFAYIPRHHRLLAILFIALGLFLFLVLWNFQDSYKRLSRLEFSSSIFWSITAIALSLWETMALVIARLKDNNSAYPTISELVVPVLSNPIPRLQFIALWILIGWLVIRHWKHP